MLTHLFKNEVRLVLSASEFTSVVLFEAKTSFAN